MLRELALRQGRGNLQVVRIAGKRARPRDRGRKMRSESNIISRHICSWPGARRSAPAGSPRRRGATSPLPYSGNSAAGRELLNDLVQRCSISAKRLRGRSAEVRGLGAEISGLFRFSPCSPRPRAQPEQLETTGMSDST